MIVLTTGSVSLARLMRQEDPPSRLALSATHQGCANPPDQSVRRVVSARPGATGDR